MSETQEVRVRFSRRDKICFHIGCLILFKITTQQAYSPGSLLGFPVSSKGFAKTAYPRILNRFTCNEQKVKH